jgi:hypothetical protein
VLGLGPEAPTATWGNIALEGITFGRLWLVFLPSLAIAVFAIGANLFADGLGDALDPRLWSVVRGGRRAHRRRRPTPEVRRSAAQRFRLVGSTEVDRHAESCGFGVAVRIGGEADRVEHDTAVAHRRVLRLSCLWRAFLFPLLRATEACSAENKDRRQKYVGTGSERFHGDAPTIRLRRARGSDDQLWSMARAGIEPATPRFSAVCSTN